MKRLGLTLLAVLGLCSQAWAFDSGTIAYGPLTTSYALVYTVPVTVNEIMVFNTTDADVFISWTNSGTGLRWPAGHHDKINLCKAGVSERRHGLTVYVKEATTATEGNIIVGDAGPQ